MKKKASKRRKSASGKSAKGAEKQPKQRIEGERISQIERLYDVMKEKHLVVAYGCPHEAIELLQRDVPCVIFDPEKAVETDAPYVDNWHELLVYLTGRGTHVDYAEAMAPDTADPAIVNKIRQTIAEASVYKRIRENTVRDRLPKLLENGVQNLPYVTLYDHIPEPNVLQGMPAFVVSAGPSLDKNRHLLRECRKYGPVVVVNTSARPALLDMKGSDIDLLVTIEALDVTHHLTGLEKHVQSVLVDITANKHTLEWAAKAKKKPVLLFPQNSLLASFNYQLAVPAVAYGPCVAHAAVAQLAAWGVSHLVLVGQDLAYADDGRVYAEGSKDDKLRWEIVDEKYIHTPGKGKRQPFNKELGWGKEGEVISPSDLNLFRKWFEGFAQNQQYQCKLINATEGGAHIQGWEDIPLKKVLGTLSRRKARGAPCKPLHGADSKVPVPRVISVLERLQRGCEAALRASTPIEAMLECQKTNILREYVELTYAPRLHEEGQYVVETNESGGKYLKGLGRTWTDPTKRLYETIEKMHNLAQNSRNTL